MVGTLISHLALVVTLAVVIRGETNVFVVYEIENGVAGSGALAAINYLQMKGHVNKATVMNVSEMAVDDSTEVIGHKNQMTVCIDIDMMIDEGNPPDVIVDLTEHGFTGQMMKYLTVKRGWPTIASSFGDEGSVRYWDNLDEMQQKYLVQVRPPTDAFPEIVRKMAMELKLNTLAILYEKKTFRNMPEKYSTILRNMKIRFKIQVLDDTSMGEGDYNLQLQRLREDGYFNFFVFASVDVLEEVVSIAFDSDMKAREKYYWFMGTLDTERELDVSCCPDMLVTFMKPKPGNGRSKELGLKDTQQLEQGFYFDMVVKAVMAIEKMRSDGVELINFNNSRCEHGATTESRAVVTRDFDFLNYLKMVSEQPAWGPFHLMQNGGNFMDFDISVEMLGTGGKTLGTWTSSFSNNPTMAGDLMALKKTRMKMSNVLRVVAVHDPPMIGRSNVTNEWEGYMLDLLYALKDKIGFEFELYEPEEQVVGHYNESIGKWAGVMKELELNRADIAIGSIKPSIEREVIAEFSIPVYDKVGISIMMKKPIVRDDIFKFANVMQYEVWYSLFGAFAFTSFFMWVVDKWSEASYQNRVKEFEEMGLEPCRLFTLKESAWFTLCGMTPQGAGEAPLNAPGRVVGITWWIFCFVSVAAYTANLAAFLTIARLEKRVARMDDLAFQFNLEYSTLEGADINSWFARIGAIERRFYEIWKTMSLDETRTVGEKQAVATFDYPVSDYFTKTLAVMRDKFTHYNNMTIVKKLLRESANNLKGNAYVGEYNEIRYIGVTNCDLLHVKENFAARHLSVATPKGSPLIHKINEAIQELWDVRAFDDWSWKWWKENVNEEICIIIDDRFGGISIQNFAGVFSIPIFGIMIASIGLVVEYYYYRDKPRPGMFGDEDDVSDASGSASGSGKGSSIKKENLDFITGSKVSPVRQDSPASHSSPEI